MDYQELLKLAESVKKAPKPQQHKLRDELWHSILVSIADGNWNAETWAKVALQVDESLTLSQTHPNTTSGGTG